MNDHLLFECAFQAQLNMLIRAHYNKLIGLVVQVPQPNRVIKVVEGTGGKVSIADIIAYQIGWGTLLLDWYTTGLRGEMPLMPGAGFDRWNYKDIALHFYQQHTYDNGHNQLKQFYTIVKDILEIVEKEDAARNLDKKGVWKWCILKSGKKWPLSKWIWVTTGAAYKRAIPLVRKIIKAID